MRVGIMQPYFLPYIGYWQLMNTVDRYVIYDDVNYIKRGWINRNRILINGKPSYLTIPLHDASQNKKINELKIAQDQKICDKNLRMVELAYKKAPYFDQVFPLYEMILMNQNTDLSIYLANSFKVIATYLEIKTNILFSSSLDKDETLKGQDKILEICKILKATEYINAIGGRELYDVESFLQQKIQLLFLQTGNIRYKQFGNSFCPNLSILDVMMFNSRDEIKKMLSDFTLI